MYIMCDMCTGSSLSWGYSSREREGAPPEKPESGFASRDSDQLLEYLRSIQNVQLKLICSRVCIYMTHTLRKAHVDVHGFDPQLGPDFSGLTMTQLM